MNPDLDPRALRQGVDLVCMSWDINAQRERLILQAEPKEMSDQEVKNIEQRHRRLLWEIIPKATMPSLPQADAGLLETGSAIGVYRILSHMATSGKRLMLKVETQEHDPRVLKVYEKQSVMMPGDIESICRESTILKTVLDHPNIIKCYEVMHSNTRLYLVLNNAGPMNLLDLLSKSPKQHLNESSALHCFGQLASALDHCHVRSVAHHRVQLEHIVVQHQGTGIGLYCQLVDFSAAIIQKAGCRYQAGRGTLPCVAPEIACTGNYTPLQADCWSAGVVLLETAGGLGSMGCAVGYKPQAPLQEAANMCMTYFSQPDAHASALSCKAGVCSPKISRLIKGLMHPCPTERLPMSNILCLQ